MKPRYYTIGMAGHIDHGKTTLTKALTHVDTDRLKEEKERQISIELGYAPFPLDEYQTSIVDVPGHERFIRQMIAGVAGIDLVILVIAADEGVMPQTREHIEILSFLGIQYGIIAVTKADRVEPDFIEFIEEDIQSAVKDTVFEKADIVFVDSISKTGFPKLISTIKQNLSRIPERNAAGAFRLPIDQVFTVQGQGTVVRGTIYEGTVETGDALTLLPYKTNVKARKLQVHHQDKDMATAGQRVAINLSGLQREEVKRGDVLVAAGDFSMSSTLDIMLTTVHDLQFPLKQRAPIRFHSGTAEVMGEIIFFDRKELKKNEEVLCQIRLDEPVAVKRGDRYVIRRPTPVETIGGGWVIDPFGEKYRFGEKAIWKLQQKKEGSPEQRLLDAFHTHPLAARSELLKMTSMPVETLEELLARLLSESLIVQMAADSFTSSVICEEVGSRIVELLQQYHETYSMRTGMNKAECIQALDKKIPAKLTEMVIDRKLKQGTLGKNKQYLFLPGFTPHFPSSWKQRLDRAFVRLYQDELGVLPWNDYLAGEKIPEPLYTEVKHFLLQNQFAYPLDEKHLIHGDVFASKLRKLYQETDGQPFSVQEAKAVIEASRKNLILFLELLDQLKITQRTEEKRNWAKESSYLSGF